MAYMDVFAELFKGNMLTYGVFIPDNAGASQNKSKGKSFTKKEALSNLNYSEHLSGKTSLGITPVDQSGNVYFAAIDIDTYPINFARYCAFFARYNLPFIGFRSKSGGLHIFCFFSKPEPAAKVIDCLQTVKHILGLPITTEVFPKQKKLSATGTGNWINLPYFNANNTQRYAFNDNGEPLPFAEAMDYCTSRRTTLKELSSLLSVLPFSQAPPCLQTLYLNDEVNAKNHNRDIFLFNCCVYLKARYKGDFGQYLYQLNDTLPQPLPRTEIDKTLIGLHTKTTYAYQCNNTVLHGYCNQALCSKREYGRTNDSISDFDFGQLIQVCTDPPYYKWTVDNKILTFYSETELIKQEIFMEKSIRELGKCPKKLSTNVWIELLNKALNDMKKEDIGEDAAVFSEKDIVFAILSDFLLTRPFAAVVAHISLGQVYHDAKNMRYVFRLKDFLEYWENLKKHKVLPINKLHDKLKKIGVHTAKVYDKAAKKQLRVCCIKEEDLDFDIDKDAIKNTLADVDNTPCVLTSGTTIAEQLRALASNNPTTPDETTALVDFEDMNKEKF